MHLDVRRGFVKVAHELHLEGYTLNGNSKQCDCVDKTFGSPEGRDKGYSVDKLQKGSSAGLN